MATVRSKFAPITVKDLRITVEVDPKHPVTKAMLEHLPRVPNDDLKAMLKLLRNDRDDADVRSWIALVEAEIAFRATSPQSLVEMIAAAARSKRHV